MQNPFFVIAEKSGTNFSLIQYLSPSSKVTQIKYSEFATMYNSFILFIDALWIAAEVLYKTFTTTVIFICIFIDDPTKWIKTD
jgi:hypothetical protein